MSANKRINVDATLKAEAGLLFVEIFEEGKLKLDPANAFITFVLQDSEKKPKLSSVPWKENVGQLEASLPIEGRRVVLDGEIIHRGESKYVFQATRILLK